LIRFLHEQIGAPYAHHRALGPFQPSWSELHSKPPRPQYRHCSAGSPSTRSTTSCAPPPPRTTIRSLDAIHLATADAVLGDDLTAFVSYDRRLLAAATALGLPTTSPGA
jgi:hypothetical protein